MEKRREFVCPVPASLVKDPSLSARAKLLYLALAAHADARTGRAYLSLKRLEKLMGCARNRREAAQRELVATWLVAFGVQDLRKQRMGSAGIHNPFFSPGHQCPLQGMSANAQSSVPAQQLASNTSAKLHLRSGTPESSTLAKFLPHGGAAESASEKSVRDARATPALPLWSARWILRSASALRATALHCAFIPTDFAACASIALHGKRACRKIWDFPMRPVSSDQRQATGD
jgi:hypothetical protein